MGINDLNFHQTFPPEREHIAKILSISDKIPASTKEEIFEITNIPTGKSSGKVVPHIKYAEFMGLIKTSLSKQRYSLSKTPLGSVVSSEDSYLMENLTQVLCHYFITSRYTGAPVWSYIFRSVVPALGVTVDTNTLTTAILRQFGRQVNLTPFKGTYSQSKGVLSGLNILEVSGDTWTFKRHEPASIFKYCYGFTLLLEWEAQYPDRTELSLGEITDSLAWNKAFLWDTSTALDVLDWLTDIGMISINRQLNPIIIIRKSTCAYALEKLYSLLV